MTNDSYAQDGVSISAGDEISARAARWARETWEASPHVVMHDFSAGNFRGPRATHFTGLPKGCLMTGAADGIGTKVVLYEAGGLMTTAGRDVVAMTAGDITRYGGLPLLFSDVLDVRSLGDIDSPTFRLAAQFLDSIRSALLEQNIVWRTGETAELGPCVGSENPNAALMFNCAGFAEGVYHPQAMITGDRLAPGQPIVALQEHSFRSNGISSVRKAFAMQFGEEWWDNPSAQPCIRAAARPSILYDKLLAKANGWGSHGFAGRIPVTAIAHITGGGIPSKFGEDYLRRAGLSATLNDLWELPWIMRDCADWRGMSDEELYQTWNGGQGALVVLESLDAAFDFISLAGSCGIKAKVCGDVHASDGQSTLTIRPGSLGQDVVYVL